MLCKNGDEEKKSLQKHFLILIGFFLSNISFCKLLYHQIGGIGFDIFFVIFFLCVVCVTTWDLALFYAILMHFFSFFISYRVTQGKSLTTLLEHPVKLEWLFFISRHALYHFRSPARTCFNKESKSSTLLSCWPRPGLFLEQDRACSDLLLLFVPLLRWPLSSLDAPPESENECKKLLIYVYVWYVLKSWVSEARPSATHSFKIFYKVRAGFL